MFNLSNLKIIKQKFNYIIKMWKSRDKQETI